MEAKHNRDFLARVNAIKRLEAVNKPTDKQMDMLRCLRKKTGYYSSGDIARIQEKHQEDVKELRKKRGRAWKEWNEDKWSSGGRAIYRWIRNKKEGNKIRLEGGSASVRDRLKVAAEAWGGLWKDSSAFDVHIPEGGLEPITWVEIEVVINRLADGKAKGADSWSPAELRAFTKGHLKSLAGILNRVEKERRWPSGMGPIVALIPIDGAENEGHLRPIAVLPYKYRVWMAIRKGRVKECH